VVLVGPSGCGKSTTLRMIAGLEDVTDGDIMIGGDVVNDVPPKDRDIAMGGQRQRVAMGRAIVRHPKVFLFEEPLSNLDAKLRVQMRIEIKKVHQKVRTTTVYVTHDQVEAMTLADRVVVMNHGRIEQVGSPNELCHNPATRFVTGFIGSPAMNFIPCRLEDISGALHLRLTDVLALTLPPARSDRYGEAPRDAKLLLGLRPEHIVDAKSNLEPGVPAFDAMLDVTEPMGMETLIYFTLDGVQICGRVSPNAGARDGGLLRLAVDLNNMHLLNEVTGAVHLTAASPRKFRDWNDHQQEEIADH
jgi:multiple sugar transport system ATP-binding protein